MPWTLGSEIHVETLRATDIHVGTLHASEGVVARRGPNGYVEDAFRYDLSASSGDVTIATVHITGTDQGWNCCTVGIDWTVMRDDSLSAPFGTGSHAAIIAHNTVSGYNEIVS